jgi:hypothetical protein
MEPWMLDPEAAWWAKLRRADEHLIVVADFFHDFQATEPYTLTPEDTDNPDEVAYRLRVHREAPADLMTVVGDVLHNLGSALDSLAFGLAVRSVDRELTEEEEGATQFPICETPDTYGEFFGDGKRPDKWQRMRGDLYGPRARKALRAGQPFYWAEQASSWTDDERRQHYADNHDWSELRRLRRLNNIDKHRRLPALLVGWPGLFYFGSDEGDNTRFRWGQMPPENDTILCYLTGPKAKQTRLHHEFALVLSDDPTHRPHEDREYQPQDCMDLLRGFAQEVRVTTGRVLQVYAHGAGATPPGPPDRR